jgi:hypothetical protein
MALHSTSSKSTKRWQTGLLVVASGALVLGAIGSLVVGDKPAVRPTTAGARPTTPLITTAPSTTTTTTVPATTTSTSTTSTTTPPPTTVPQKPKPKTRRARIRATFTIYPPLPASKTSTTTVAPTSTAPVVTTPATTTPTATTPTTVSPTTTEPGGTKPAAGFVAGRVTAVGDSVMLDYATPLQHDVPGIDVDAAVSRQWDAGEAILSQLKSEGRLGATVVVGLGTNGPITAADFDRMMSILAGATKVVFVNVVVDRPWQDPDNTVLAQGVAGHHATVLANWASLEAAHPGWVYSDGTHLPIDGPGAVALAQLIASKV